MANPSALYSSDGTAYLKSRASFLKICESLKAVSDAGVTVVGIRLPKEPEYLLSMLACMALGLAYVPLSESFPESRIEEIKEDSGLGLIIDQAFLASALQQPENPAVLHKLPTLTGETPLYIIFTSGSTGRPKGVVISRRAFIAYYQWLDGYLAGVNADDRVLQVTEFTFDISLIDLILLLTKRCSLYFTGFNGAIFKLAQEIADYQITTLSTVPNNINMMLDKFIVSKADFTSLKEVMIGGARFSYGLYQKVQAHFQGKSISNFYGPTEFTIYSHAKKIQFDEALDCEDHNVAIGTPNTEVQGHIYRDGQFQPAGERGELLLCGAQIMSEYIRNPQKTAEALVVIDGVQYYRTGDLAYCNPRGEFFVVGRMDDTIKYRGYRINLLDIDSYIAKLAYVQDVTTIAVPDEIKENITVCYLILKGDAPEAITPAVIKKDLATHLVEYQIPEKIVFIDRFPTNVSGKVCKKQLLEIYQSKTLRPA